MIGIAVRVVYDWNCRTCAFEDLQILYRTDIRLILQICQRFDSRLNGGGYRWCCHRQAAGVLMGIIMLISMILEIM